MGYEKTKFFLLTLLGSILLILLTTASVLALQSPNGSFSACDARAAVRAAERNLERAKARLSEARHVESATRGYGILYGAGVSRWVRLARRSGYAWREMPILMRVIDRESGGNPSVPNGRGSGALGLLQIMSEWADGSKAWYWKPLGLTALWSRTSAWESLRHGAHMGWGNWGE